MSKRHNCQITLTMLIDLCLFRIITNSFLESTLIATLVESFLLLASLIIDYLVVSSDNLISAVWLDDLVRYFNNFKIVIIGII